AGKNSAASCHAPATDMATVACITKASGKATASLDKACFVAPATHPSGYNGVGLRPNTSAGWGGPTETAVYAPAHRGARGARTSRTDRPCLTVPRDACHPPGPERGTVPARLFPGSSLRAAEPASALA